MCGICGIYGFKKNAVEKAVLTNMCRVLSHRGPDDEGKFLDDHIGLGVRRLSVIDLITGHQPIHNEDESVWVVFNGEIYNYKHLRELLEKRNHKFYTASDTETIIHLYEEYGKGCVHQLNGMFAFALWDGENSKLFLARDRLGIKPLHYTIHDDKLIFGSEIKSILAYPGFKKEVDPISLHHYLGLEYVPSPRTMFKNIKKMQPGHILVCDKNKLTIEQYWDLKFNQNNEQSIEYSPKKVYKLLKSSVERRLISDVPLGALLSGGIDSSSIVGLMSQIMTSPVKTFSIGFEDESYNELKYARKVAEYFGTDHHEEILRPDAINLVDIILQFLDEPFADVSVFPTFLVSKLAKKHVTVVLSGDGGDELFAGYDWYIASRLDEYYQRIPSVLRKGFARVVHQMPPSSKKKGFVNMLKRFIEGSSKPLHGRHIRWQFFITNEERNHLYASRLYDVKDLDSFDTVNVYYRKHEFKEKLSREQYVDVRLYLPDDILTKLDRMSMGNSLEARVPFLDHKLVEFSGHIPAQLKLRRFTTKYILKKTMSRLLPKFILRREKQGFSVPIKEWLKNELRHLMFETLSKKRIKEKGYFNYEYIQKIIRQHLTEEKNNAHQLWALIMFELWHEKYINSADDKE